MMNANDEKAFAWHSTFYIYGKFVLICNGDRLMCVFLVIKENLKVYSAN